MVLAVVTTPKVAGVCTPTDGVFQFTITLLLGVDRFMSQMRSMTNLIGNGVATIVVSKWEREFDEDRATRLLNGWPDNGERYRREIADHADSRPTHDGADLRGR
jgi:Na+/H+-dicarboxylate symporter